MRRKKHKRRPKQKASKKRAQKRRKLGSAGQIVKPWQPPKMEFVEVSSPFSKDLTKQQRLEMIRQAGKEAKQDFDDKFFAIQQWFDEYDQVHLLAFCAFYFLSFPEGVDPEAHGEVKFFAHYLEILQAFALIRERNYSLKPVFFDSQKLLTGMKDVDEALKFRALNVPTEIESDEELHKHFLRWTVIQQTAAIRNWGYHLQMKRLTMDLAGLVKGDLQEIYGLDSVRIISTLYDIVEQATDKLNMHLQKLRSFAMKSNYKSMMKAYNLAFPDIEPIQDMEMEKLWELANKDLVNLLSRLASHSDLRLEDIYTVNLTDIAKTYGDLTKKEKLRELFERWSLAFGDLKCHNVEHFILDNPVHKRPFVKTGPNRYFSPILGVFPHLALGLVEDLIAEHEDLRKKYSDSLKPKYLEDEVGELFRKNFPNAHLFRGSEWDDPITKKRYENDLIAILDTFALIVECKSGQVTPPAKRGATKRLAETLKALVEEPAEQANRFIGFLQNNRKVHSFKTKTGTTNVIDSSTISYYIPVGVTLEPLGFMSSDQKKLIEAGISEKKMSELAPSVSLKDLESIFELLTLEAEKVHYLARRREFESHVSYEGDELDLLSFYLDNGFNIGAEEFTGKTGIIMIAKSKEIDPYFEAKGHGIKVPKPRLAMTKWWRDLLEFLVTRKPEKWVEISFILLNSSKEDQEEFERQFDKLKKKVSKGNDRYKHNWTIFVTGPTERRYLIAGYPYLDIPQEDRNNVMAEILNSDEAKKSRGAVCIGIDVARNDYPYSVLAGTHFLDLFTDLDKYTFLRS